MDHTFNKSILKFQSLWATMVHHDKLKGHSCISLLFFLFFFLWSSVHHKCLIVLCRPIFYSSLQYLLLSTRMHYQIVLECYMYMTLPCKLKDYVLELLFKKPHVVKFQRLKQKKWTIQTQTVQIMSTRDLIPQDHCSTRSDCFYIYVQDVTLGREDTVNVT